MFFLPNGSTPVCPSCSEPFTFSQRRTHCRFCGAIFCTRPSCTTFVSISEFVNNCVTHGCCITPLLHFPLAFLSHTFLSSLPHNTQNRQTKQVLRPWSASPAETPARPTSVASRHAPASTVSSSWTAYVGGFSTDKDCSHLNSCHPPTPTSTSTQQLLEFVPSIVARRIRQEPPSAALSALIDLHDKVAWQPFGGDVSSCRANPSLQFTSLRTACLQLEERLDSTARSLKYRGALEPATLAYNELVAKLRETLPLGAQVKRLVGCQVQGGGLLPFGESLIPLDSSDR